MEISIIIPAYNEASNITDVVNRVKKNLVNEEFQIVFVDDGSTDLTLESIKSIAMTDSCVRYISFSRNFGHQAAIRAGIELIDSECIILMDCDLQHPPELIPDMITLWRSGFDVVATKRIDHTNQSFFKKFSSNLFYKLMNILSEIQIDSGSADFRLINKKVIAVLRMFKESNFFLRGLIQWIGFKQTTIEYFPDVRSSGESKYSFNKMLGLARDGLTSFSVVPLHLSTALGAVLAFFSLLYGFYAVCQYIFTNETVEGWTSLIVVVCIIGGLNLLMLGLIGEYLGRTYMQSKSRPNYIVKATNIISN